MDDLVVLIKEHEEISARRNKIVAIIKDKLTVHYKNWVFHPFITGHILPSLLKSILDNEDDIEYSIKYTQIGHDGELINNFVSYKILNKNNIEEVLKKL